MIDLFSNMDDINIQEDAVFIPHNVPSSKNSKVKTKKGVFNSKTVSKYLQKIGVKAYHMRSREVEVYKTRENIFESFREPITKMLEGKEKPYKFAFHFVRKTRTKFDFHNLVQILADLMVAHRFIDDDDMTQFLPIPFKINDKWYSVDKNNPGVYIIILD